ncbi:MAG: hypothetical protein ABDH21_01030 [bacterium]
MKNKLENKLENKPENKPEKKVNHIKEVKLIPLNTPVNFDDICSNNDILILNYSSPNTRMIFKFIDHFFSHYGKDIDSSKLTIACIIPHKVKHYEEYLIHNLPFPIYQTTDFFSLQISKNSVLSNRESNFKIFDTDPSTGYDLAYLFLKKNNEMVFHIHNQIGPEVTNTVPNKYTYFNIPTNFCHLVKDIRIKPFRKGYLLVGLKNIGIESKISMYLFVNQTLEKQKSITINRFVKSLDFLPINHNDILLVLLTIDNKLVLNKYTFDKKEIEILEEFELSTVNEKLTDLDLKKIRINHKNIVVWDHNTIYILKHNFPQYVSTNEELNILSYNVSGQKSRYTRKPTDGIWKQTIWGNINNVHLENNFIYVADIEYSVVRKVDLKTGKSYSLLFSSDQKEREKLKGKISECIYTDERTFIIDLYFKKIRYIDNRTNIAKTIFYDEEINLFTQLFFLDSLNSIVYNTFNQLNFIDLYRMDIRREVWWEET